MSYSQFQQASSRTIKVMAVLIALMAGVIAALAAGFVGTVLGIGIVIILGWSGAGFITVTGLTLVIQQSLGLL